MRLVVGWIVLPDIQVTTGLVGHCQPELRVEPLLVPQLVSDVPEVSLHPVDHQLRKDLALVKGQLSHQL